MALPSSVAIGAAGPASEKVPAGTESGSLILVLHGSIGPPSLEEFRNQLGFFIPPVTDFVITKVEGGQ